MISESPDSMSSAATTTTKQLFNNYSTESNGRSFAEPNQANQMSNKTSSSHKQTKNQKLKSSLGKSKHKNYNNHNICKSSSSSSNQQRSATPTTTNAAKKQRKKFEQVTIDGFVITAFRSWENLQDDLNEQIALSIRSNNNNNSDIDNHQSDGSQTQVDLEKRTNDDKNDDAPNTGRSSSPSSSLSNESRNTSNNNRNPETRLPHLQTNESKYMQFRKLEGNHNGDSTTCNGSATTKSELERALEAKELAEKHLAMLKKKLRKQSEVNESNIHEQNFETKWSRESQHDKNLKHNAILNKDLLRDPNDPVTSYPSFDAKSQPPRFGNEFYNHQAQNTLDDNYLLQQMKYQLNSAAPLGKSSYHRPGSPPMHQSSQSKQTAAPNLPPFYKQQYPNQAYPFVPNHLPPPTPPHSINHSLMLPPYQTFPSAQQQQHQSSLSALQSPYNCPYIVTDTTISRQTSIMPSYPTTDQTTAARFGLPLPPPLPITSYNQTYNQSSYYPPSPTERSFLEFARNYTNSSYVNNYSSSINSTHANPSGVPTTPSYMNGGWPRMGFDVGSTMSRLGGLFPGSLLDKQSIPQYPMGFRPPTFSAGLYQP